MIDPPGEEIDGSTPLAEEELEQLIPSYITLRHDFTTVWSGFTSTPTAMAVMPDSQLIYSWCHMEEHVFLGDESIWLTRVKLEMNILQHFVLPITMISDHYLSLSAPEKWWAVKDSNLRPSD